jgi:hypothetical protein
MKQHSSSTRSFGAPQRLLIAALIAFAAAPAVAVGWVKILEHTPAEQFDDEDLRLFIETARDTLNAEGEPQLVKWNNPATGSGGSFQVIALLKSKSGAPCKKLRLTVYAKARAEMSSTPVACLSPDKRWQFGASGR